MGNRAVIGWQDQDGNFSEESIGVYLHWNGGRDSVEAFLAYCEIMGFRSPSFDSQYGVARFIQVVANWFGEDGLSIGVDKIANLDTVNWDNGLYICKDWRIVDRKYAHGEQLEYSLIEFIHDINEKQTEGMRKGKKKLDKMIDAYFDKYGEPTRRQSKAG